MLYNIRKVTDDLYYVGGNDHRTHLFENIHPIPEGVSYNSYLLKDEKNVLIDTVDWSIVKDFLERIKVVLNGEPLDYLLIHHLELDHAGAIEEVILRYPDVKVICSEQGFEFMSQTGYEIKEENKIIVKEGDTLPEASFTVMS